MPVIVGQPVDIQSEISGFEEIYRDGSKLSEEQQNAFESWVLWMGDEAFRDAATRLERLSALRANWDSYGAEPPNAQSLDLTRVTLTLLKKLLVTPTRVVASAEGGATICFVSGNSYADIEFLNSGEILAVTYKGNDEPFVWQVQNMGAELYEAIARIKSHLA